MNTVSISNWRPLSRALSVCLIAIAALWALPRNAHAQLWVADADYRGVYQFDPRTGDYNHIFISGLGAPWGLAIRENTLFVADAGYGQVGAYNATTGATINTGFITGLNFPTGVAVSGNILYVASYAAFGGDSVIGIYNARTGYPINPYLITGLGSHGAFAVATLGNNLYVTFPFGNVVGKYNAKTGATINANFISVNDPFGIVAVGGGLADSGGTLYVVSYGYAESGAGTIGTYNGRTGATINSDFITGLTEPYFAARLGFDLFVTNYGGPVYGGVVGKYNAFNGYTINSLFLLNFGFPTGIAVRSEF